MIGQTISQYQLLLAEIVGCKSKRVRRAEPRSNHAGKFGEIECAV